MGGWASTLQVQMSVRLCARQGVAPRVARDLKKKQPFTVGRYRPFRRILVIHGDCERGVGVRFMLHKVCSKSTHVSA